ncbi:MAG: hypothetical protein WBL31_06345 [Ilumatobacteraceae bacterium]
MERLCERPGCSDPASVAYGMRAEDLVFWLDRYPEGVEGDVGVLCRRHADSMVVPRGWTLDDLRDPDLHLFRPPAPVPSTRVRRGRVPRPTVVGEQLELDDTAELAMPFVEPPERSPEDDHVEESGPWTPEFDEADDLDGLLSARSPLLSRAFRTADRPDG